MQRQSLSSKRETVSGTAAPKKSLPVFELDPTYPDPRVAALLTSAAFRDTHVFYSDIRYKIKFGDNKDDEIVVKLTKPIVKYKRKTVTHKLYANNDDIRFAILSDVLGEGGYGKVYRVAHTIKMTASGQIVKQKNEFRVAKVSFNKNRFIGGKEVDVATNEQALMSRIIDETHVKNLIHDDSTQISCILSRGYPGTTLFKVLCSDIKLSPEQQYHIARKVLMRVKQLHAAGIVHGDLKPENFLILRGSLTNDILDGHAIDFGLSRDRSISSLKDGPVGTPGYYSPEDMKQSLGRYLNVEPQSIASDNFTLSIILSEIFSEDYIALTPTIFNKTNADHLSGKPLAKADIFPYSHILMLDAKKSNGWWSQKPDLLDVEVAKSIARTGRLLPTDKLNKVYDLICRLGNPTPAKRITLDDAIVRLDDIFLPPKPVNTHSPVSQAALAASPAALRV